MSQVQVRRGQRLEHADVVAIKLCLIDFEVVPSEASSNQTDAACTTKAVPIMPRCLRRLFSTVYPRFIRRENQRSAAANATKTDAHPTKDAP